MALVLAAAASMVTWRSRDELSLCLLRLTLRPSIRLPLRLPMLLPLRRPAVGRDALRMASPARRACARLSERRIHSTATGDEMPPPSSPPLPP